MATLYWPDELPLTLPINGLSVTPQDIVIRTAMDAGPKKARRRYTARPVRYTGAFFFSAAEYALFMQFYRAALADGVLRFVFTDPVSLDEAEFRFAEAPKAAAADGCFNVSVVLERLS